MLVTLLDSGMPFLETELVVGKNILIPETKIKIRISELSDVILMTQWCVNNCGMYALSCSI